MTTVRWCEDEALAGSLSAHDGTDRPRRGGRACGPCSGARRGLLAAVSRTRHQRVSGASAPVELNVSAAATLKSVLTSTAPTFEKAHNVKLVFNFGASGVL